MNDHNELPTAQNMSAFLPLTLLAISFIVLLAFQVSIMLPQRSLLQKAIAQSEQAVAQSKQTQAGLQKLVMDLVAAAPEDKDAQAIITKYGIQVSGTSPVPAASPAASISGSAAPSATPAP